MEEVEFEVAEGVVKDGILEKTGCKVRGGKPDNFRFPQCLPEL